jgi:hypothetical protein
MPYQPKIANAVKERLIIGVQFGSKPRSIHIELEPPLSDLHIPRQADIVAAISMGCPALFKPGREAHANPWNLIRVMPAEGSLR